MKPTEWIDQQLRIHDGDRQVVYGMYEAFRKATGSSSSYNNFKRTVRRRYYDEGAEDTGEVRIMEEAEGPNKTIVTESHDIRTLEELLAYCKVDLSLWKVKKHVVNMWGSSTNSNFQVKAWLERRDASEVDPREEIDIMLADAKGHMPAYKKLHAVPRTTGNLLEISLFDHHFGQLSWGDETRGSHYDAKIATELAHGAVDYMISRSVEAGGVDRILITIGNDFFNVNGASQATFAGTPQSEDGRWQKTFTTGRRLWIELIEKCHQIAPVDVFVVPGNHDFERIFYLGDAIDCWFNKSDEIRIDNSPVTRKYYEWGQNLIGFTHGNQEPSGSLVNIMSTEMPMAWSRTKYREWHKGHFHHAKATAFQILDETRGIREWILPSLVAVDDYHAGKGYASLRESIGMIWNKEMGKTDMFMYHPPEHFEVVA